MLEVLKQARNAFVWNLNTDLDNIPACDQWAKMLRKNIDDLDKAIVELESQGKTMKVEGPLHVVCQCDKCKAESQEPVAWHIGWLVRNSQGKLDLLTELQIDSSLEKYERLHKLYTHPPQRTWVDLTDSQIEQIYYDLVKIYRGAPMPWGQIQFGKALQAKLKEKNT